MGLGTVEDLLFHFDSELPTSRKKMSMFHVAFLCFSTKPPHELYVDVCSKFAAKLTSLSFLRGVEANRASTSKGTNNLIDVFYLILNDLDSFFKGKPMCTLASKIA